VYSNRLFSVLLVLLVIISACSCATILAGSTQKVILHCSPSDSIILVVDGKETPFNDGFTLLDKTRDTHFVTIRKNGYKDSTLSFNREVDSYWLIADIIWGPAYPLAVILDWQTGAFYRFNPYNINVVLRKNEP